jgi:hypothetical protein
MNDIWEFDSLDITKQEPVLVHPSVGIHTFRYVRRCVNVSLLCSLWPNKGQDRVVGLGVRG